MWEFDCEEGWVPKNWCFWTVVFEKTLESPLDCKEIQPIHSKGDQSWVFIGRNDAEAETPVLWPPHAKNWLTGKDWCWEGSKVYKNFHRKSYLPTSRDRNGPISLVFPVFGETTSLLSLSREPQTVTHQQSSAQTAVMQVSTGNTNTPRTCTTVVQSHAPRSTATDSTERGCSAEGGPALLRCKSKTHSRTIRARVYSKGTWKLDDHHMKPWASFLTSLSPVSLLHWTIIKN